MFCLPRVQTVLLSEAKQYHAFARECLEMAEKANDEHVRRRLIELSHEWMAAALMEECRQAPRHDATGTTEAA